MNDVNFTHLVTKKVERILGREIEYATEYATHISKGECADCKKPAKYLIVEKQMTKEERENVFIHVGSLYDMRAWYYCGRCMVG
jgi:hypothetical protein